MDKQVTSENSTLCLVDKLHNLSLRILTLCGFGAMICLAVNIVTALVMLVADRKQK